ncbi:MAG TPA: ankyrin repeat domain-containing protein [Terracidiphilus sp.]|nr:ankyrin repeat domain-containing protein [Terracidiphilus sp.]
MAENLVSPNNSVWTKQSSGVLTSVGVVAIMFTGVFAGRILWEETFLTMRDGPQMLGFSLAHGPGAILFLAPAVLVLWMLIALAVLTVCLLRKRALSKWYWSALVGAVLVLGTLSIPPAFWQWWMIGSFAKSPHAADLMIADAADGDVLTVRRYLQNGVPLSATNYEGSTAAFAAAAGGSLPMIEMLASRGADLNATNLYGDSPLEAASENNHPSVVAFLKSHGALKIRGTPEQRDAASQSIVRKEIEREEHLR